MEKLKRKADCFFVMCHSLHITLIGKNNFIL